MRKGPAMPKHTKAYTRAHTDNVIKAGQGRKEEKNLTHTHTQINDCRCKTIVEADLTV